MTGEAIHIWELSPAQNHIRGSLPYTLVRGKQGWIFFLLQVGWAEVW